MAIRPTGYLALSAPDVAAEFLVEGLTLRKGQPTSGNGGGLYARVGNDGAVTVNRNRLENNTAGLDSDSDSDSNGGGASISATTVILAHNSITGNTANAGGGVSISATTASLTHNNITGNKGSGYLAGAGGACISATTATLTHNRITGNTSSAYVGGDGGAYIYADTATLTNNSITGNRSHAIGGGGGAFIMAQRATLTNNSITGNTGAMGGGLFLWIGITETTDAARLYNNLFWDNEASQGADLLINYVGDYLPTPVTLLANNFDQAQPTGFSSTPPITIDPTNLNQLDPLFVDASAGDFHLQSGSPMIDAGYPGTPNLPDFDIEGTPRVLGASVDMGAYEYGDGSFYDVIPNSWAAGYINAIRDAGITGGCGNGNYCPFGIVTRSQMAAFLIRAIECESAADLCGGIGPFYDVSPSAWYCSHVKRLVELTITGGCGNGNYCPEGVVNREQMAVFIVRALEGEPTTNYCAGVAPFMDVPSSAWSCRYIKRLAELNVTQGCGNGNYCPYDTVTREQMAAFLARAFLDMD